MVRLNMEELVSVFSNKLEFDNKNKDLRVFIFKNKDDLISKYVSRNLVNMKVDEPNSNEKYDNKFKHYLEELRLLVKPFSKDEMIVIAVFGIDIDIDYIDTDMNDVRLYHIEEISLLVEDSRTFYTNQ